MCPHVYITQSTAFSKHTEHSLEALSAASSDSSCGSCGRWTGRGLACEADWGARVGEVPAVAVGIAGIWRGGGGGVGSAGPPATPLLRIAGWGPALAALPAVGETGVGVSGVGNNIVPGGGGWAGSGLFAYCLGGKEGGVPAAPTEGGDAALLEPPAGDDWRGGGGRGGGVIDDWLGLGDAGDLGGGNATVSPPGAPLPPAPVCSEARRAPGWVKAPVITPEIKNNNAHLWK